MIIARYLLILQEVEEIPEVPAKAIPSLLCEKLCLAAAGLALAISDLLALIERILSRLPCTLNGHVAALALSFIGPGSNWRVFR
jgi:hypothetical protein